MQLVRRVTAAAVIIIINEFHRDASLTKTSGPLSQVAVIAVGSVHVARQCQMQYCHFDDRVSC